MKRGDGARRPLGRKQLLGERSLQRIEFSLDIAAGQRALLRVDDALLHVVPLGLSGRVELRAVQNGEPSLKARVRFNQSANSGVDGREEVFHGDPAHVVRRIVEEGQELAAPSPYKFFKYSALS